MLAVEVAIPPFVVSSLKYSLNDKDPPRMDLRARLALMCFRPLDRRFNTCFLPPEKKEGVALPSGPWDCAHPQSPPFCFFLIVLLLFRGMYKISVHITYSMST